MNVLVDLTVLELPATGIARVVTGLYGAVAARHRDIALSGISRRRLRVAPPHGMHCMRIGRALPAPLWRHFVPGHALRTSAASFVHFPWNGGVPRLGAHAGVITTLHDVLPLMIPGYFPDPAAEQQYRTACQRDIDRSNLVVTDSEFSRGEILRHFRIDRDPVVIPCATDIARFTVPRREHPAPYFLYVGGLDARKSLDVLLRVFPRMVAEHALQARLIVTGSARHAPASLRALLDEGVRSGSVEFRDYVDDRELARLYGDALALVYPSRYEGFGLPPLEAMTLGCPVITCRMTSIPEVCGDAAYYIDPAREQSLAEALRDVAQRPELRERLRASGLSRARVFSWARTADMFVRELHAMLDESSPR